MVAAKIYDFKRSPVLELTDNNFSEEVTKNSSHIMVVEFYTNWCDNFRT